MDVTLLVPAIVTIAALVVVGLAGAGFGTDSRDTDGPGGRRSTQE